MKNLAKNCCFVSCVFHRRQERLALHVYSKSNLPVSTLSLLCCEVPPETRKYGGLSKFAFGRGASDQARPEIIDFFIDGSIRNQN